MSHSDGRYPLKKLLLCLCLVLFIGGMVLPAAVFGYVAPNEYGVREGQGIPFSLIPEAIKSCVPGWTNCFVNVSLNSVPCFGNPPCPGGPITECLPDWAWYVYLIPIGFDDWNRCCKFLSYRFLPDSCNYDPNTYDYDGDGIPDIADNNPDTPPSKMAKGNEEINTAYDKKQAETQGGG